MEVGEGSKITFRKEISQENGKLKDKFPVLLRITPYELLGG